MAGGKLGGGHESTHKEKTTVPEFRDRLWKNFELQDTAIYHGIKTKKELGLNL